MMVFHNFLCKRYGVEQDLTTAQICDQFLEDITEQANVDIYQLMAVIGKLHFPKDDDHKYCIIPFYFLKAVACFIFQTVILAIMIYQFSDTNIVSKSNVTDPKTKIVACSASIYIAFSVFTWWRDIEQQGLYQIKLKTWENCPTYVNKKWLYFGLYANLFTLFIAVIGSNMLIYWAEDSLNVILNCVAIFFMVQIDNEIIGVSDYKTLKYWYTNTQYHKTNEKEEPIKNEQKPDKNEERKQNVNESSKLLTVADSTQQEKYNSTTTINSGTIQTVNEKGKDHALCIDENANKTNNCYRCLWYFQAILHMLLIISAFVAPLIITILPYKH